MDWIPVYQANGEVLPHFTKAEEGYIKESDNVLVCTHKGEIYVAALCDDGEQFWWAVAPNKGGCAIMDDVVAWMPLPKPMPYTY